MHEENLAGSELRTHQAQPNSRVIMNHLKTITIHDPANPKILLLHELPLADSRISETDENFFVLFFVASLLEQMMLGGTLFSCPRSPTQLFFLALVKTCRAAVRYFITGSRKRYNTFWVIIHLENGTAAASSEVLLCPQSYCVNREWFNSHRLCIIGKSQNLNQMSSFVINDPVHIHYRPAEIKADEIK